MSALTREQLEGRLVALHRASLELVREISLKNLLKRIAEIACEQVDARYAAVGVLGPDGALTEFITVGISAEEIRKMEHPPVGRGLIGALMESREAIRIPSIGADPRSVGFPEHHPPMHTFLGVPIRQGELALGQIYLTNKNDGSEFSEQDQQIIEMLASYAAAAISNARLYAELLQRDTTLIRRNENLALLNELAVTLSAEADADEIIERALTQVMEYLHLDVGELFLRQEESKTLKLALHRGKTAESLWVSDHFVIGEGIIGKAAQSGQPRLILLPAPYILDLAQFTHPECFRQLAVFPLSGRRGVIGVMCVATCQPHPLTEMEMQFLLAISTWIGTAVENIRLNLQGKRLAVLEERDRIGMDLHDGIIQSIYAVGLTLEHARLLLKEDPNQAHQRIEQAVSDLNSTIRDIRAYILDLRPRHLNDENLMDGISRLVAEFRANTLVDVNLSGPADGLEKLGDAQTIALFHICQEALANIAKHARAKHVEVAVWTTAERVLMEVRDDGKGFDFEKVKLTLGHGVSNMQTRVRNVGGDIDIITAPDEGTSVLVWVPFEEGLA